MQSFLLSVGEKFVPILKESNFKKTGKLTPEEVNIKIVVDVLDLWSFSLIVCCSWRLFSF